MIGRSQAGNLSGMLTSIGDTIGEMGGAGNQYVDTFRRTMAPELDMNNPESMAAYGEYLRRNGREEEAAVYMEKGQARRQELRKNEGKAKIMRIKQNMEYMTDPAMVQKANDQITQIAQDYEVDATELYKLYEAQDIARRGATVDEQQADTARIDVTNRMELGLKELEQQDSQFGQQLDFEGKKLAEEIRYNDFLIDKGYLEISQGDRRLGQEDRRLTNDESMTQISRMLANEEITMGEYRRVIMGNEDARAQDMHPIEKDLKKTEIRKNTALAGYTDAQTETLLYELGFARDTEQLREDAARLANNKTAQEIETDRQREGYYSEQSRALSAQVKLDKKNHELARKMQEHNIGMDQATLELKNRLADSEIELTSRQIEQIASGIDSQAMRDEVFYAQYEATKITEAQNAAYARASAIDVTNPTAVENARRAFVGEYGSEHLVDFDEAFAKQVLVRDLEQRTSQDARMRESYKPPTEAELKRIGLSDMEVDAWKATTDPEARNQLVANYVAQQKNPAKLAAPTQALVDMHEPIAERIVEAIFPAPFLNWAGNDLGNNVTDEQVRKEIQLAMARATAAGKSSSEVMIAGYEATIPYLEEAGSATGAAALQGYRNKYAENL